MRVLGAFVCLAAAAAADFAAPEYTIDLDKSAYDRWAPVANDVIGRRGYEYTWAPLHAFLENILPHNDWVLTEPLWEKVLASYPQRYQEEIHAFKKWIDEQGHPEWTLGQLVMVQLFYEVEDACTSIVAQHANGTIFHGRNLDYGLPGLENFTITATFTRSGAPVARGTMYLGYIGLLTGQHMLPDGTASWSISLDQRFYGQKVIPYIPSVEQFLKGVQNVGFFLRDALTNDKDYASALPGLKNIAIPAPAYLIAAGTAKGEGAVITRDRNGTSRAWGTGRGFWPIDTTETQGWYRLETNFDNWEPVTDGRRKAAHKGMDALGQSGADAAGIMQVLSTPPVLAGDTTYTAIMINEAGYYHTTVREHDQEVSRARTAKMTRDVAGKMRELLAWYKKSL